MNRKLLLMTMVIVALSFMASGAMALSPFTGTSYTASSLARGTTNPRNTNSGNTAGTIVGVGTGSGDALIFPYYDVRPINVLGVNQEQDFYFAIINETVNPTTISEYGQVGGVAAKLRFREFDKSIEVYDVDIWLSCNDVWVGVVTNNNGTAHIWSPDWVIVLPDPLHACLVDDFTIAHDLDNFGAGKDFRVALQNIDPARSLLGYIEVIATEMTTCAPATQSGPETSDVPGQTGSILVDRYCPTGFPCIGLDAPNTLAGYAYIVRPTDGVAMGYNAVNIDNFSVHDKTGNGVLTGRSGCGFSLFAGAGSENPTLKDCEDTLDQLEFELSKFEIYGGFAIETGYVGRTSTVVTFPTKHFHFGGSPTFPIDTDTGTYGVGTALFWNIWGDPFVGTTMNVGEPVTVRVWDRDENEFSIPGGFESPPAPSGVNVLPYEVNVIGWYTGSSTPVLVGRDNIGFPVGSNVTSGWFLLQFPSQGRDLTDGGNLKITDFDYYGNLFQRYAGLPAIGLIVQQFNNVLLSAGGAYGEILPVFSRPDWEKPDGRSINFID